MNSASFVRKASIGTLAVRLFFVLVLGFVAIGLVACGGDDEKDSASSTGASTQSTSSGSKANVEGSGGDAGSDRNGASQKTTERGSSPAQGRREEAAVDLSVDPSRVKAARVTATGAVQTLPASAKSHRIAQRNSYTSIKAFGEEAEGDEATNITFALVQYLTAKANGDWAVACARLYSTLREQLEKLGPEPRGCPEAYGALIGRSSAATRSEQARIDVSSVRRGAGNRAFVIYKTPDTLSADMPMYVEDGVWKVGAVDAYVLTPEEKG